MTRVNVVPKVSGGVCADQDVADSDPRGGMPVLLIDRKRWKCPKPPVKLHPLLYRLYDGMLFYPPIFQGKINVLSSLLFGFIMRG